MTRVAATLAALLVTLVASLPADAAPKREPKRAYKPADRRQQDAEAQPAQDAEPPLAATYEDELRTAKEKRDKELQDATAGETDQRTLEKKKQEIFAQYAAIVAALRDKYEAAHPDDAQAVQPTGKNRPKTKYGRPKPTEPDDTAASDDSPKSRKRPAKSRDNASVLADAQEKLAEEITRHQAKLDQLNAQLDQAKTVDNAREVRRMEKAIEKENNSYTARKAILERRVIDLGGSITPPPPPKPATPTIP